MKFKDILLVGAVILLLTGGVFGDRTLKTNAELEGKVELLQYKEDSLLNAIATRDSNLVVYDYTQSKLLRKVDSLESINKTIDRNRIRVERENRELVALVDKVSSDSSYKFTQEVWKTGIKEKSYGYDSLQVQEAHRTILENQGLTEVNSVLISQVVLKDEQLVVKDSLLSTANLQLIDLGDNNMDLGEVVVIEMEKNRLFKKQLELQNKNVRFFKVTTGIAGIAAIIFLAL